MEVKVVEYREKNPKCKYCEYYYYTDFGYCAAKKEFVWFPSIKAKKCELFRAETKV